MDIPKKARYLPPQNIVADGGFMGANDTNLGRAAAAYALRCCGNTAHFFFNSIISAPSAAPSDFNTWTDFTQSIMSTGVFDIPWHHQDSFSSIVAYMGLVASVPCVFEARIKTDDLIDAVATSTSPSQQGMPAYKSTFPRWSRSWWLKSPSSFYDGSLYRKFSVKCILDSPTMPANRRVVVIPQVTIPGAASFNFGLGQDPKIYIESIVLMDIPDRDTEG